MSHRVPEDHPLRRFFHAALDRAFLEHRELYSPEVASHLGDEVLCDFVHVDRLYRLRDASGSRVESLHEMVPLTFEKEGPERRMEVDRYIGDFTLFMGAFFPAGLRRRPFQGAEPLVAKVRGIFITFDEPLEYYKAEGRNAYARAAETARLFDPASRATFSRLSEGFDDYVGLLGEVKEILAELPEVKRLEDDIG
jgi:hypothetical protein